MSISISTALQLNEQDTAAIPKVWCDMDGVVADFHATFQEAYELSSENQVNLYLEKPNAWHIVAEKTPDIFAKARPLPDAEVLVSGLKHLRDSGHIRLNFLTALPGPWMIGSYARYGEAASRHKKEWIVRHFSGFKPSDVVTCERREKPSFGVADKLLTDTPQILLDDYKKNTVEWIAQTRGFAIQHKSAASTLSQLGVYLKGLAING